MHYRALRNKHRRNGFLPDAPRLLRRERAKSAEARGEESTREARYIHFLLQDSSFPAKVISPGVRDVIPCAKFRPHLISPGPVSTSVDALMWTCFPASRLLPPHRYLANGVIARFIYIYNCAQSGFTVKNIIGRRDCELSDASVRIESRTCLVCKFRDLDASVVAADNFLAQSANDCSIAHSRSRLMRKRLRAGVETLSLGSRPRRERVA